MAEEHKVEHSEQLEQADAAAARSVAVAAIKKRLPKIVDKVRPEDICDELLSEDLISVEDVEDCLNESNGSPKSRTRTLILKLIKTVEVKYVAFDILCHALEKSDSRAAQECGKSLKAEFENAMSDALKPETHGKDANQQFKEFKERMLVIRNGILQSDENREAKYEVAKEFISFYISRFNGKYEGLKKQLQKLCHEEFVIPTKLHDWSFQEAERIMSSTTTSLDPLESPPKSLESSAPQLFSKDNVYHCILLCRMVLFCNEKKYVSFLSHERHEFQNVSLSLGEKSHGSSNRIEKYAIAERGNVLYVAFLGEKNIYGWQEKYTTFNEGIKCQVDRTPMLYFVDKIRSGFQVIFTGHSFGGLLAAAVNSTLWHQSCLSIEELQSNVACIAFAPPLVSVEMIVECLQNVPEAKENTYFFYYKNDVIPRILSNVEKSKVKELRSSVVLKHLAELHTYSASNKLKQEEATKHVRGLKDSLKEGLPSTADAPQVLYGVCRLIYPEGGINHMSDVLPDQSAADVMMHLNSTSSIDEIRGDLVKKHTIEVYNELIQQAFIRNEKFGPKLQYKFRDDFSVMPDVKPSASVVNFTRIGDEISLVVEGDNLWFCNQIKVGSRDDGRIINTDLSNASKRSVHFNYTPKDISDLIVGGEKVIRLHLVSHFCNPIKQDVEVNKQDDYEISFRQRQLASNTPTDIIVLSFLSAMLEKSPHYQETGRRSKRFNNICQFLEKVVCIVPAESMCFAITNFASTDAWRCTDALVSQGFQPHPSVSFIDGLKYALEKMQFDLHYFFVAGNSMRIEHPIAPIHAPIAPIPLSVAKKQPLSRAERSFYSDVVKGRYSSDAMKGPSKAKKYEEADKHRFHNKLTTMYNNLVSKCKRFQTLEAVSGQNISELYPAGSKSDTQVQSVLEPPISVLGTAVRKLQKLQQDTEKEIQSLGDKEDSVNEQKALHNEKMIETVDEIIDHDLNICAFLLGAFMQQQIRVPFVNSPQKTAHILQTMEVPSSVGVWALFSLDMLDMQKMLSSKNGMALFIEVQNYIDGIYSKIEVEEPFRENNRYAGKLQFLARSMRTSVSCNTSYISYSLERQLYNLCKKFGIKSSMTIKDIVSKWDQKFQSTVLFHVMEQYRSLLARWLLWSLSIHSLREELAKHTTVGVIGLSNSGKSSLVSSLFKRHVIVGSTTNQRTTIPFLYNLDGIIDGLDIIDFPGVDDKDNSVKRITWLLLQLAQIVIVVIDYRRFSTESATKMLSILDRKGIPLLLCLTHADKLYANECLRKYGKDCPDDTARRVIERELERVKTKLGITLSRAINFYSFSQDGDSVLDSDEGRETLQRVGIKSPYDVGIWVAEQLKGYVKQEQTANSLLKFISDLPPETAAADVVDLSDTDPFDKPVPLTDRLRGAECSYQTEFEFTGDRGFFFDWEGYGFKIDIPAGTIKAEDTCQITIRVIKKGQFNFPKYSDVVSGVYWIHSTHQFLKPVDVILNHCAKLESIDDCKQMKFIIARCNQEELPYNFSIKGGSFSPKNTEGIVSLKSFSIISIIWAYFFPEHPPIEEPAPLSQSYYSVYFFVKQKNPKTWHYDIVVIKAIETLQKDVADEYKKWSEDIPHYNIELLQESLTIRCTRDADSDDGWKVVQKNPNQIKCKDTSPFYKQAHRIAFRWTGNGEPSDLQCEIILEGVEGNPQFTLEILTEDMQNDTSSAVSTQDQDQEQSPTVMQSQTCNPSITINVNHRQE